MELIGLVLIIAAIIGLVLGIWWLIWSLWCFVLPSIWAAGPENIIRPGFWLFCGMWLLLGFIGRLLFYHPTSKD